MAKRYGLLTERQLEVLRLRRSGLTHREIAERFGTSRENVVILEKRALRKLELAKATLKFAASLGYGGEVRLKPGMKMVDIPRVILDEADRIGLKLRVNFTRIYDEIRFRAGAEPRRGVLGKPVTVYLLPDGDIWVECGEETSDAKTF